MAVDPVVTVSYGGGSKDWLLVELELPIGFRLLDLQMLNMKYTNNSPGLMKILEAFGCSSYSSAQEFFTSGAIRLSEKCRSFGKKIFQEELKIDGFSYGYGDTNFVECKQGEYSFARAAFVITDSKWMKPESVRYYTENSTHLRENRIMIQTIFFKAIEKESGAKSAALAIISNYLVAHPDQNFEKSTSTCDGNQCVITVDFCDDHNICAKVNLPPLPRLGGGVISAATAPPAVSGLILSRANYLKPLLWDDLEGAPKAKTVSEWIKSNKFACEGKAPY